MNRLISVTLLSDMCSASGDGFAGFVDTDVCFDESGLPYIPGKRLKGCLRECGLDIVSVDDSYTDAFEKLFGVKGSETPGTLYIGNGRLGNNADITKKTGDAYRSEISEAYTSVRSRTRIESGTAAPGTLRTVRTLNKGLTYVFPVTLPDTAEDSTEYDLLYKCVKTLRHMGMNRSRGLGEVKCGIEEIKNSDTDKTLYSDKPEETVMLNIKGQSVYAYTLLLREPVIPATRSGKPYDCENYIFGSSILGILASRYIENYRLSRETAHEDAGFRRIFLDGDVIFTAALPYKDGKMYHPAPLTLRTNKIMDRLSDESCGIQDETDDENPICKRLGGFIYVDGNYKTSRYQPEKSVFMHHARPDDKSCGHADASGGDMFTYEALKEGQMYKGYIIGQNEDVRLLTDLIAKDNYIRIGRSRTAQYGLASINPCSGNYAANRLKLTKGDEFRITAVTPVILENENGVNTVDLTVMANELNKRAQGCEAEIVRFTCAETITAGYNSKWRLPRGQQRAISEGSVVVFKYKGDRDITLDIDFMGKRTAEGYGQINISYVPKPDIFTYAEQSVKQQAETIISGLPEIISLRKRKDAVARGAEYGDKYYGAPSNANLQRIITALSEARNFAEFTDKLNGIKQQNIKGSALAFTAQKDKYYFKTDKERLTKEHITNLLINRYSDYEYCKRYLSAAVRRVKQKRREDSKNTEKGSDARE